MQLRVAFASDRHAKEAVRFLAGSSLHVTACARPARSDADMALVDIEIPSGERRRLEILLVGVHGIIIEEPAATFTTAG